MRNVEASGNESTPATRRNVAPRQVGRNDLTERLRRIVGRRHVLTRDSATRRFRSGYRVGKGPVLAVVRPGSLVEMWRSIKACVEARVIVILQSANTGLTGGSTPDGTYDRDVVLINTLRLKGIYVLDGARQVVCLPGATLYELEKALEPYGREPHSVIGSSCIGASVIGGICNNSGGSLVQRGPAYTELALYARVDHKGELRLVNHLGIALEGEPEDILRQVGRGVFDPAKVGFDPHVHASAKDYGDEVRKVNEGTPARFNADPRRLHEASGSAGKVAVFAARLDTFARSPTDATFYIGSNSVVDLTELRRDILQGFAALPVAGEYIHRTAFDVAAQYGKDTVIAIERLGTHRLPMLFALRAQMDALARRLPIVPAPLSDLLLQAGSRLFAEHLPSRMLGYRDRFEHHLILKMDGSGVEEARAYLAGRYPSHDGDFFECSKREAAKAFLHRFAVAGAAMRYEAMHRSEVEGIISLDIALRRNDRDWFEELPQHLAGQTTARLYYGHFFCHVFHQDYIVRRGSDVGALKAQLLGILDGRGAEYPAEHNVGHVYEAKPSLAAHYRRLDPCNALNPGLGRTARGANWAA